MPAFNVNIPATPGRFDLKDPVDPVDRKLESLDQAANLIQHVLYTLTRNTQNATINGDAAGATWSAGNFPVPGYITSGGGVTAYEALLTNTPSGSGAAALTSAGLVELMAEVCTKLQAMNSLT